MHIVPPYEVIDLILGEAHGSFTADAEGLQSSIGNIIIDGSCLDLQFLGDL